MSTIADVVRQARASVSTVSSAPSGARLIKQVPKARAEAAMAELGDQPKVTARSLAARSTRVLATIHSEVGRTGGGFVRVAAQRARECDHHLKTSTVESPNLLIPCLAQEGMSVGPAKADSDVVLERP